VYPKGMKRIEKKFCYSSREKTKEEDGWNRLRLMALAHCCFPLE